MTGKLSKNFHGVGIGPLSKILAVKYLPNTYVAKGDFFIEDVIYILTIELNLTASINVFLNT